MPRWNRAWTAVLLASPLVAGADEPVVLMEWYASSDPSTPLSFNPADAGDSITGADGSVIYTGSMLGNTWDLGWTTGVQADSNGGFLQGVLTVINLSSESQDFSLDTTMQLPNPLGNSATLEMAASLALTNMQFNGGAQVQSMGNQPIVEAHVNGGPMSSAFESPYLLEAFGPFGSAVDNAVAPGATIADPTELIGMLTSFSLSPGDLLNITYIIDVSLVPAPGALVLLTLAAVTGSRRSRRRGGTSPLPSTGRKQS